MKPLTPKQRDTVQMIWEFSRKNGYCPTINQVAEHFGIQNVSAYERILALVGKGALTKSGHKSRSYFLTDNFIDEFIKDEVEKTIAKNWICLSKKQWDVAYEIKKHYDKEQLIGPSVREISGKLKVSHATVFGHIESLEKKKALTKSTRQWRSAKLSENMLRQINFIEGDLDLINLSNVTNQVEDLIKEVEDTNEEGSSDQSGRREDKKGEDLVSDTDKVST